MPNTDKRRFRNEDLILAVSSSVDRGVWDESRYEAYLDALCGIHEYQKDALRVCLRYLLGGRYSSLRELARENFDSNDQLQARFGSWPGMERHLQLPDQLAATLDLATGTGKSYVLFGLAAILLAEDVVDRVLVLCPSTTIELGLLEKFRALSADEELHSQLPETAAVRVPSIINASESITPASICVENYHAILEHVGSSVRDSLAGIGARVLVLNDEAHHVVNESESKRKRWKEFLLDPKYGFRFVLGVSGTCYVGDDYFSDVIYRYALKRAIEERFVKNVEYIAEMPKTGDPDEKWQVIRNRHEQLRRDLTSHRIRPLTIIVTQTVARCRDVADELRAFLVDHGDADYDNLDRRVLIVYNNSADVQRLPSLDDPGSQVEWIVSVSMLNEGWDVKRVFQIVPHEERAFNSKLLIAQVLGRGLRMPTGWQGSQPEVTVFNHDAWAPRIRHLVNEILEFERRISSRVLPDSTFHFTVHNIDYTLQATSVKKPMAGEYTLFAKGYVDLASDSPSEDISIELERVGSGERRRWQTRIEHLTYSPHEIAIDMFSRLEDAQNPDDIDPKMRSIYTDTYPIQALEGVVIASLKRIGADVATDSMKQKFLQSLGPLRRRSSENVRYTPLIEQYTTVDTSQRPGESASASELKHSRTLFYTDQSRLTLTEEQVELFDEVTEQGSGYKSIFVSNQYDLKTPLNLVIADHEPERRFISMLLQPENVKCHDAWIKSTPSRFYEIEFAWKKGEHPKRAKFSPDIFIRAGELTLIVEIKGDEELSEPSEENRKKAEYAHAHFARLNERLANMNVSMRYKFNFLTERNFNTFFHMLRNGTIREFRSELDVVLSEKSDSEQDA